MKSYTHLTAINRRYIIGTLLALLAVTQTFADEITIRKYIEDHQLLEKYKKHNHIIAFDSSISNVQESGLSYVTRKTLYLMIDGKASKELSPLILDYDPLSADITITDAYIVRKDGTKDELFAGGKEYDYPAPARMIYWGARQKMVEPGKLNSGDAVYLEYVRKGFTYALLKSEDDDKFIPPMRGHYYDIVEFFDTRPIHHKYYRVNLPKSKELIYQTYNADFTVNISHTDNHTTGEFELSEIFPPVAEFRRVANVEIAPKLIITTTKQWEAKSQWFFGVNEDYGSFKSTPEIDAKVKEILKGATDELDSIGRLNRWAADEIRYSGISMGKGEGYTLHTGEMNFTDRCGVCKDKAGMLITMLRAAGFESYAAMTMAGSKIEDIPADQFNHSVTVVKLRDGTFKLLDPTWVPFVREMWSSREQQQNYLMGLPQGSTLMITPISSPENHYLKIDNNATIDLKGNIKGTISVTAEGQSDATVRSIFTRHYRHTWEQNLKNQILDKYPQAKIIKAQYSDPYKYYEAPVQITIEYEIPQFAHTNGKTLILETLTGNKVFGYAQFYDSWKTNNTERKYDIVGNCSQQVEITEKIKFPNKIEVNNIETLNIDMQGEYVSIKTEAKIEDNELTTKTTEQYEQRIYPAAAWDEFNKAITIKNNFRKALIIKL